MSNQYNDALVADLHRATNGETWTVEKNAELYPFVAAGDKAAREAMINGNMPLVLSKVEAFIRSFPNIGHLRDDLVSAGFTGLVKAVNQMVEGCQIKQPENWNPTDCIGAWINRELGELVDSEATIHLPARSKYRARAEGRELKAPVVCNTVPERFEVSSCEKELEMRDLIESCCTCEEERTFIAAREAGHTLTEIATAINKSRMSTQRMRVRLDARVQRKLEALRDE